MIIISFDLEGKLKTMRPLSIHDINFCDESASHYTHIKFAQYFETKCAINIKRLISYAETKLTFNDLYLNYTENGIHLMKSVPILIRDVLSYNKV